MSKTATNFPLMRNEMTMRDEFAALALRALLPIALRGAFDANLSDESIEQQTEGCCLRAFDIADKMMKARQS